MGVHRKPRRKEARVRRETLETSTGASHFNREPRSSRSSSSFFSLQTGRLCLIDFLSLFLDFFVFLKLCSLFSVAFVILISVSILFSVHHLCFLAGYSTILFLCK